jgi:predicted aspartyl protease
MGRTFVEFIVENYEDVRNCQAGKLEQENVRSLSEKALVDTGSSMLCLHKDQISQLGLLPDREAKARTANGVVTRTIYGPARISLLNRHYWGEVMEVPDNVPLLLGYIPLENLDLVVDPKASKVIPNPESGGEYTLDLL